MSLKGKQVLVTGGAGFIGSHLVDRLLGVGADVVAVDNFDTFYDGKERNIQHNFGREGFHFVEGDILDYDFLSRIVEGVEIIFHEGAQPGVRYCIENPLKAHRVNVSGTLNVLWAAKEAGVKKVVYASSSSIFGDPKYLPIDEEHPTNPVSPYGASKLGAENYCLVFNRVYGLPVVSLRYFSVYGPRGRPDQVMYRFAQAIRNGRSPLIYGDGSQTRDFTYITDVVQATMLAAEADDVSGMVLNIGAGCRVTVKGLAMKLVDRIGKNVESRFSDSQSGDPRDTEADNSKARRILGWKPTVGLDEGLNLFLDWFNGIRS